MTEYNPAYLEVVQRAATDSRTFATFKKEPGYRIVLEHLTEELGGKYLTEIARSWPESLSMAKDIGKNDRIGSPDMFDYAPVGQMSPTTLRYWKVACDLRRLFGDLNGFDIAEIGGGYGGQLVVADALWPLGSWTFFDLDPVLDLVRKYLSRMRLRTPYHRGSLDHESTKTWDLVISNYAFSEISTDWQVRYLADILARSKRGYMTINDRIIPGVKALPGFRVMDEVPLTHPGNYIIVWGTL